jgi:multidrug efflux pump subunit AcrB
MDRPELDRGVIAWMTGKPVVANLLMWALLLGGLFTTTRIKQEVFPKFDLDIVSIVVVYPGAGPAEVEQGIVLAIDEVVRGLEGVKRVTATAAEGVATIMAELYDDGDHQKVYQDVKQEIDRIRTLPEDAEEPQVTLLGRRRQVLDLQLYGNVTEWALRELAEEVRDRLLQSPEITQVEFVGARRYELHVEVSLDQLRAHGLTLEGIARQIRATALELPGGSIETSGGEILLRVQERRDWAREFGDIPIVATDRGTVLRLEDIATLRDGFEDVDRIATYNGLPSVGISVFRVGNETPIGISEAVARAIPEIERTLPPGIEMVVNNDRSTYYRQRLELLMKNAFVGLALVLVLLGIFLEARLAFWVTMGIPTAFLGGLLFLPLMDVSINMVSMFAFIVALGIVVDDAIVAGENVYEYRKRGMRAHDAAVRGARDIAAPVGFSIVTNVIAFIPLYMVPGVMGKIWGVIPVVVITVFLVSWVEALLILPAHLAHMRTESGGRLARFVRRWQQTFSRHLDELIAGVYAPFLDRCVRNRYVTLATGVAVLAVLVGYAFSGRVGFILMPRVEANRAVAVARLPFGSPVSAMIETRDILTDTAREVVAEHGGSALSDQLFALIEENSVEVNVYLTDPEVRPASTSDVTRWWRAKVGTIPGLESLRFQADAGGPGSGAALTVELSHRDIDTLERASAALSERLAEFPIVKDIDDGFAVGKEQLDFTLKPEGHSLGLTVNDLARQVRSAFYGAEALRQQRSRNEVKVLVRLPEAERVREYDLEELLIRTPAGTDVPLMHVASVARGRAYTTIERRDGRRTVLVTADVVPIGEMNTVLAALNEDILPAVVRDHPGLTYGYEGRQAELRDSTGALLQGFLLAMILIYALLAVPFGSYLQPAIVMVAIPFGMAGAVLGHILMGYSLSILSFMGMIALSGVVVNDALILVDYANRRRAEGTAPFDAIMQAGVRRFRPILLTTLTTFGGLAPMIFETSRQARFMVPMAISLGHGIVFATLVTLVLVPSLYCVVEDLRRMVSIRHVPAGLSPSDDADTRGARPAI